MKAKLIAVPVLITAVLVVAVVLIMTALSGTGSEPTCAELDAQGDRQVEAGDYAAAEDTLREWLDKGCDAELTE